ncbi:MAG: tetratricopeptide repeat protein [Phycisphaerae bacterium]|nr:tetratricopeptide repeat protein [Phycisphaerae bacterium]
MGRVKRQVLLAAGVFVVLGIALGLLYLQVRAGSIQAAEGRRVYDTGRFELAEQAFERATRANPKEPDPWYWLGMSRRNQGQPARAAEAFARATALEPQRVDWWVDYAQALQWAEQFKQAEEAWGRVLALLPPHDERVRPARLDQVRCVRGQKQFDRAIGLLEDILAHEDDYRVRLLLGETLAYAGRFDESTEQYRRALSAQQEK